MRVYTSSTAGYNRDIMSTEYVIALIGLFIGLCAVAALAWAIAHRQLQTEDRAMYETVADDELDYTDSASRPLSQPSRRTRWLFFTAFGAVFVLIGWLIVQTVRVSSHALSPMPVQQRPPSE